MYGATTNILPATTTKVDLPPKPSESPTYQRQQQQQQLQKQRQQQRSSTVIPAPYYYYYTSQQHQQSSPTQSSSFHSHTHHFSDSDHDDEQDSQATSNSQRTDSSMSALLCANVSDTDYDDYDHKLDDLLQQDPQQQHSPNHDSSRFWEISATSFCPDSTHELDSSPHRMMMTTTTSQQQQQQQSRSSSFTASTAPPPPPPPPVLSSQLLFLQQQRSSLFSTTKTKDSTNTMLAVRGQGVTASAAVAERHVQWARQQQLGSETIDVGTGGQNSSLVNVLRIPTYQSYKCEQQEQQHQSNYRGGEEVENTYYYGTGSTSGQEEDSANIFTSSIHNEIFMMMMMSGEMEGSDSLGDSGRTVVVSANNDTSTTTTTTQNNDSSFNSSSKTKNALLFQSAIRVLPWCILVDLWTCAVFWLRDNNIVNLNLDHWVMMFMRAALNGSVYFNNFVDSNAFYYYYSSTAVGLTTFLVASSVVVLVLIRTLLGRRRHKKVRSYLYSLFQSARQVVDCTCLLTGNDQEKLAQQWRQDVAYLTVICVCKAATALEHNKNVCTRKKNMIHGDNSQQGDKKSKKTTSNKKNSVEITSATTAWPEVDHAYNLRRKILETRWVDIFRKGRLGQKDEQVILRKVDVLMTAYDGLHQLVQTTWPFTVLQCALTLWVFSLPLALINDSVESWIGTVIIMCVCSLALLGLDLITTTLDDHPCVVDLCYRTWATQYVQQIYSCVYRTDGLESTISLRARIVADHTRSTTTTPVQDSNAGGHSHNNYQDDVDRDSVWPTQYSSTSSSSSSSSSSNSLPQTANVVTSNHTPQGLYTIL